MIEELIGHLDNPSLWVVRGGPMAVLATEDTLRKALMRAHVLSANGQAPTSIREMPDDRTVPAEQIWELWKRIGLR
jgi:hypothetical protein